MSSQPLVSFGIDPDGGYARSMTRSEAVQRARLETFEPLAQARGVVRGIDPADLASAGWGVVFAESIDPEIRKAMAALTSHRRAMATARFPNRFQELTYRPGESKMQFLMRHNLGPGPVDPDRMPYYLLLVGGPEEIPFSLQYQLAVQFAVGRLCFDTPEEYAAYAESVVRAETGAVPRPRQATLFGVHNRGDRITGLCIDSLVRPLAEELPRVHPDWSVSTYLEEEASKARLSSLLGGDETPGLLFTAGHAVCFSPGDERQRERQGALVCNDWPGPQAEQCKVLEEHYLTARDITDGAQLHGVVCFHLACFSAGTPRLEYFGHGKRDEPKSLSPQSFVARLPQRLLAHDNGGALAVIGHVDTAWEDSFNWKGAGGQSAVYQATLYDLMAGLPVGMAMEHFGARYAEISTLLNELQINSRETGEEPDDDLLVRLWTAHNDARSFMVLGDPAVRLRTEA